MKPWRSVLWLFVGWLATRIWPSLGTGLPGFLLGCGALYLCWGLLQARDDKGNG